MSDETTQGPSGAAGPLDDPEYEDVKVWLLREGGERFHYAAEHAWEALEEHVSEHESECFDHPGEELRITLVGPAEVLAVSFPDGLTELDRAEFAANPALGFTIEEAVDRGEESRPPRVSASAAAWAALYRGQGARWHARQICSSVY